jgi:plastocyanin
MKLYVFKNIVLTLAVSLTVISCSKKEQDEPIGDEFQLAGGYKVVSLSNGGTVSGKVTLDSTDTYLSRLAIQRDQEVCGTSHPNPSDPGKSGGVTGCIVWLDGIKQGKDFAYDANPKMDQIGCQFLPHTIIMQKGKTLVVHNSDNALHNFHVYNEDVSLVNEAQPEGAPPREITSLTKPGIYKTICDVHPWMRGFICVAEHPYYTLTDSTGSFSFAEVPPGTYTVKVWRDNWHIDEVKNEAGKITSYKSQADYKKEQQVVVESGKKSEVSFTLP